MASDFIFTDGCVQRVLSLAQQNLVTLGALALSIAVLQVQTTSFFLSAMRCHTLPSHASAEACLTGWPNAQPPGWD